MFSRLTHLCQSSTYSVKYIIEYRKMLQLLNWMFLDLVLCGQRNQSRIADWNNVDKMMKKVPLASKISKCILIKGMSTCTVKRMDWKENFTFRWHVSFWCAYYILILLSRQINQLTPARKHSMLNNVASTWINTILI